VHFLLSFWSRTAAMMLSGLTLASIVWLVALIRSFKRLPVLVEPAGVTMRLGSLRSVTVAPARIKALRGPISADALKQKGMLNLAMLDHPNVVLDVDPVAGVRRSIRGIAHKLDDPAGFTAAIERLLSGARAS
jgi:hypothetical protein